MWLLGEWVSLRISIGSRTARPSLDVARKSTVRAGYGQMGHGRSKRQFCGKLTYRELPTTHTRTTMSRYGKEAIIE